MTRSNPIRHILFTSLCAVMASLASTGPSLAATGFNLPHQSNALNCAEAGFNVRTFDGPTWPGYHYSPDKVSRVIVYSGFFNGDKPEIALKIEYALACLFVSYPDFEYQNYNTKLCEAVRLLRRNNQFFERDFYQLENYSYSSIAQVTGLSPKILHVAFDCGLN